MGPPNSKEDQTPSGASLRARAFGIDLRFNSLAPPGAWARRDEGSDEVVVAAAGPDKLDVAWSGFEERGWGALIDGAPFAAERGVAGDHRFLRDGGAVAHLDAAKEALACAVGEGTGIDDWRLLLDSVLFSVALLRGLEGLHGGAVVLEGRAVAITAGAGGGKSTLLAALLDEGAGLLSDDIVALGGPGTLLAHPGPPLMTVPSTVQNPPGQPIADLGEESWRAVPVGAEPVPLGAILLLDRTVGGAPRLEPVERPLAPLLSALLKFPRTAKRERSRFELAAAIAKRVPVMLLRSGPEATPAELARAARAVDFDTDRRHE